MLHVAVPGSSGKELVGVLVAINKRTAFGSVVTNKISAQSFTAADQNLFMGIASQVCLSP